MNNLLQPRERVTSAVFALMTILLSVVVANLPAQGQTYSVLYTFAGMDGASPTASLILDEQGNLYGTTGWGGGTSCGDPQGCGTVFKLDPAGNETVLHSFTESPDGSHPFGSLVLDAQGNLYGTTQSGGAYNGDFGFGGGTVFELSSSGVESVLYSFCRLANCKDGELPEAGLVLDARGNLYGTTAFGGGHSRACGNLSCGTVFKVFQKGHQFKEDRIDSFTGRADGGNPEAPLIRDAAGNLYGTTIYPEGGVFKVSSVDGKWKQTVLHGFGGGLDGDSPTGGLVMDADGDLFGTTFSGGAYNYGTVFELDAAGNETVLYSFAGTGGDGRGPQAGLVLDGKGNLYGTTAYGGDDTCNAPYGCGTVFKVDAGGRETVLHSFVGDVDGATPFAGLVMDARGNLYGATFNGGLDSCSNGYSGVGCGVVFSVTP
jgi:uncharacterized repeat protein (TIGR03803 family)